MADNAAYGDWRSLELAIKDAAKKKATQEGTGISPATVDAQIRQARYDRFLSRVFTDGEASEWLLKGGMSMLARVPRSRTTKDIDLAAQHSPDLDEAERALSSLVAVDLGDHLTFRLIRSLPTGSTISQRGNDLRGLHSTVTLLTEPWCRCRFSIPGSFGLQRIVESSGLRPAFLHRSQYHR